MTTDVERFKKLKESLGLFRDDKLIYRCGFRLQKARIMYETKHPVISSNDHPITAMIINDAHQKVYHIGVAQTLSQLFEMWFVIGRQIVKKVLRGCIICKKIEGLPYPSPRLSALPEIRVYQERPFKYTGIDFCEPAFIKNGKEMEKSYIAYVHLQLIPCQV